MFHYRYRQFIYLVLLFLLGCPSLGLAAYTHREAFTSADFRVYSDAGHNRFGKVFTGQLKNIEPISIETGVEKGTPKDKRYLKFTAQQGRNSKAHTLYIHISGVNKQVIEDLKNSFPWGDERLTEAYNKNKEQGISWFDFIKDYINPDSDRAKKIIALGAPSELFLEAPYIYIISEGGAEILNEKGMKSGEYLHGGTLVEIELIKRFIFDEEEQKFKESENVASPFVKFKTHPVFFGDKSLSGYIHINDIGDALYSTSQLDYLQKQYEGMIPLMQSRFIKEDKNLTIDKALRQFHDSICTAPGVTLSSLKQKWKAFVDSKQTERSKRIAMNAYHVDLVARTIIGEAQNKEGLYDQDSLQVLVKQHELKNQGARFHSGMVQCQRDIIGLSIRNRAWTSANKLYGMNYRGDFAGAATKVSQYHIWKPQYVARYNYQLTSCLYNHRRDYIADRLLKDDHYETVQTRYKETVRRLPKVLGMHVDEGKEALRESDYLAEIFMANPDESLSSSENINMLSNHRHYFHPNNGGMKDRNLLDETASYHPNVKNGYIRAASSASAPEAEAKFFVVTNGKLMQKVKGKNKRFYIRIVGETKKHPWAYYGEYYTQEVMLDFEVYSAGRWISGSEFFKAEMGPEATAHLLQYQFKQENTGLGNTVWAALPNALFPQCFDKIGGISETALSNSVRVPMSWFSKSVRNAMITEYDKQVAKGSALPDQSLGGNYYGVDRSKSGNSYLYSREGAQPIQIRCIDEEYYEPAMKSKNNGYPQFGGYCDPNIMLTVGT